jgi:FkbM family methyltransferase
MVIDMKNNKLILKAKQIFYPIKWALIIIKLIELQDILTVLVYSGTNKNQIIPVGVRLLGKINIYIRANSLTDRKVLKYVFYDQYHLPPVPLPEESIILDLGSNIGLTLRHFAKLYPLAKIYGYEMDSNNFAIAELNCKGFNNITLSNCAVWTEIGKVNYDAGNNSDAFSIEEVSGRKATQTVNSITVSKILSDHNIKSIDYLKMDIEGAEKNILKSNLDWTDCVNLMNIEIHDKKFIDEAMRILTNIGFQCWRHPHHSFSIFAKNNINK